MHTCLKECHSRVILTRRIDWCVRSQFFWPILRYGVIFTDIPKKCRWDFGRLSFSPHYKLYKKPEDIISFGVKRDRAGIHWVQSVWVFKNFWPIPIDMVSYFANICRKCRWDFGILLSLFSHQLDAHVKAGEISLRRVILMTSSISILVRVRFHFLLLILRYGAIFAVISLYAGSGYLIN